MSTTASNQSAQSDVDAAIILTACAQAAQEWYGGTDRRRALETLARAMSRVARHRNGKFLVRKPHEMLALLSQPTAQWLGWGPNDALIEDNTPSSFCDDLLAEAGAVPELELVQKQIAQAQTRLRLRKDGQREYCELRRFLIEHGHARQREAERVLICAGLAFDNIYESIAGDRRVQCGERSVFFPCPCCTWPMNVSDRSVRCASPMCRENGALFTYERETLVAIAAQVAPKEVDVEGRYMLRRGIWRYTLLPGLVELALERALGALSNVHVELWPQFDQYDLLVEHSSAVYRVDVKDWSDPSLLARHLREHPPAENVVIVLPDHRRSQVAVLRERCGSLQCMTVSQFISTVKDGACEENQ